MPRRRQQLTPEQRAFIAALVRRELRDEKLWRPGSHGLPVLRTLPAPEPDAPPLETGDAAAAVSEPPPPPPSSPPPPGPETPAPHNLPPEWWQEPYPGGPMVKVPGFPRSLYPPDASGSGKTPSANGPDVVAYKRTVSRAGRWPWGTFDDAYSNGFAHGSSGNVADSGVAGVQRQGNVSPDTGWIGQGTFNLLRSIRIPEGLPHAGEPAMDGTAVKLIEDAWQLFHNPPPPPGESVEHHLVDMLVRSIKAQPAWHYSQARPMTNLGTVPEKDQSADCSTNATDCYFWARSVSGVAVPDPNHSGFNGYGYTGTLINNPKVNGPYRIGDMGIYGTSTGNTTHVVTCYEEGDANGAEWCSHGSEAAPYGVELHYRDDLLCVVRPGLLP